MLIVFTPDGDDVVVGMAPLPRTWRIAGREVAEFRRLRAWYRRRLAESLGWKHDEVLRRFGELRIVRDWLRWWVWDRILAPAIAEQAEGRFVVDVTTLGPLPMRGALWIGWRLGSIATRALSRWEFQNLYHSACAQRALDWSASRTPRSYGEGRICLNVPERARGSTHVAGLADGLVARARVQGLEVHGNCTSQQFLEVLDTDRPGVLTVLVAHHDSNRGIEFADGYFHVAELESWVAQQERGDWALYVCLSEESLAGVIQRQGGMRVWAMQDYAFLDQTLATLLAWLEQAPLGGDFGLRMSHIQLLLEAGPSGSGTAPEVKPRARPARP